MGRIIFYDNVLLHAKNSWIHNYNYIELPVCTDASAGNATLVQKQSRPSARLQACTHRNFSVLVNIQKHVIPIKLTSKIQANLQVHNKGTFSSGYFLGKLLMLTVGLTDAYHHLLRYSTTAPMITKTAISQVSITRLSRVKVSLLSVQVVLNV